MQHCAVSENNKLSSKNLHFFLLLTNRHIYSVIFNWPHSRKSIVIYVTRTENEELQYECEFVYRVADFNMSVNVLIEAKPSQHIHTNVKISFEVYKFTLILQFRGFRSCYESDFSYI